MTTAEAAEGLPPCPSCGAALPPPAPVPAGHAEPPVRCPGCGRILPVAALRELGQLTTYHDWLAQRASWLRDRLAAGDLPEQWSAWSGSAAPVPGWAAAPAPAAPAGRPAAEARPSAGGGGCLLAGGAVLLVLAGIAFIGFAWDLLGPAGQLFTLYAVAVVSVVAGLRLHARLPGTGTTLAVVGVLLVAVSTIASRVLGADLLGATGSLLLSCSAAVLLTAAGSWLRSRIRGVGELAALLGAALLLGLLALAPVDDAVSVGDRWAWWSGAVLLLGGLALVLLGHRLDLRSWPVLASCALLLGSLVTAGYVVDRIDAAGTVAEVVWFSGATALLALTITQLLLARAPSWRPVAPYASAVISLLIAWATAFVAGVVDPASRPLATVSFGLVAGVLLLARALLPSRAPAPVVQVLVLVAAGGAVGLGLAPWTDGWTAGRGVVAGLVFGLLLVVVAEVDRPARPGLLGIPALAATGAAVGCWMLAVTSGAAWAAGQGRLDAAAALVLVAAAGWAEGARRRLPVWSVWLSAASAGAGVGIALDARAPAPSWWPEAYGLGLAAVAAIAGALYWRLRRPAATPTMVTVAPALSLLLVPTTLAMVDDATSRWWYGEDPGVAYQVRVVVLLVAGAGLVVVGAWRRWAGVLLPAGVALLVVTGTQLVELGRFLPQWVSFAVAGGVLVVAGARWESIRQLGREGNAWVHRLQ